MPWSVKQNALFRAAAHDPAFAKKVNIPVKTAQKLASEGVRKNKLAEKAIQ
jgi:hypothetical protein